MRAILILTLALALASGSALALESATTGGQQTTVGVINSKVDTGIAALQTRLDIIEACEAQRKFQKRTPTAALASAIITSTWPAAGTSGGVKMGRRPKLKAVQLAELRERLANGETQVKLAESYGVHRSTISRRQS
jgi:hypothetical protein